MPRKQSVIIFPHLNDCGGDISKQWYIEYKWRVPGDPELHKERVYTGLTSKKVKDRYKAAEKIIEEKTAWLKNGEHLTGKKKRIYEDELHYRHEAKLYNQVKKDVVTTRTNLSEFLQFKKPQLNHKSFQNYKSKMRAFNAYLEQMNLDEFDIRNLTRQHIIAFANYLSEKEDLSRLTIDKYIQIIRAFFDYEIDRGNIESNPATKIPKVGKIVDESATPYNKDERTRLRDAMKDRDPWLWLGCQIQYYCAIRPGFELRLMKISWIDFERKQLRVPCIEAKNSESEIVEIPDFLFDEIREYNLQKYNRNYYVFGKYNTPGPDSTGVNTLRNRFNRYRDALNISPDHKFYSWKHTGAIDLIQNGAQPYDVMDHLRHKNFDTTEKYLKKRIKNKSKKISKFSSKI